MESELLTFILLGAALVACVIALVVSMRLRLQNEVLKSLIESTEEIRIVQSLAGRVLYISPGVILFGKQDLRDAEWVKSKRAIGQTSTGEVQVDGNRYRYSSRVVSGGPSRHVVVTTLTFMGTKK